MPITSEPLVMTITTGSTPLQGQKDYHYVGSFPGVLNPSGLPRYPGGAIRQKQVSYENGVTFPYANLPIKFKV
jgi:hypothetical protein